MKRIRLKLLPSSRRDLGKTLTLGSSQCFGRDAKEVTNSRCSIATSKIGTTADSDPSPSHASSTTRSNPSTSTRLRVGHRVVALCTRRSSSPSVDHVTLRSTGRYYTDFGKILHDEVVGRRYGHVFHVGEEGAETRVIFKKLKVEDFHGRELERDSARRRKEEKLTNDRYEIVDLHPRDAVELIELVEIKRSDRVLVVGVGFGSLVVSLKNVVGPSGVVVSVDRDEQLVQLAEKNFDQWNEFQNSVIDEAPSIESSSSSSNPNFHFRRCDAIDADSLKSVLREFLGTDHTFDKILVALPQPHSVLKNLIPNLVVGGSIGVVTINLASLLRMDETIETFQLPLFADEAVEPRDRSWSIFPGGPLGGHENEHRGDSSDPVPLCQPQRSQWDSKFGHHSQTQVWFVKLTKLANYDFVKRLKVSSRF